MAPRVLVLLLTCSLLVMASACTGPALSSPDDSVGATPTAASITPSPAAASFPVTLTDDAGRELVLESEPSRIVSLAPSSTEIVCALDGCDRLVGVTDFDDFPLEVADIDHVVIAASVDVELVVAAEPDLVLAAGNELTPTAVIEQLDELGLPVLVLYPETLDEVYADIELIGEALDRADEAAELVSGMEDRVAGVVAGVEDTERPLTLYEVFYSEGTTYTAGDGSFLASLLEIAGATPLTGDAQGVIGSEDLVAADPELILLGTASYDQSLADPEAALAVVAARAGWSELAAVRDGAVIPYLDDIVTTRPGPRIVDGLEALARAIHPDAFDATP
ncbi:ABC transporter substrate-binding protein [soil metagenome]